VIWLEAFRKTMNSLSQLPVFHQDLNLGCPEYEAVAVVFNAIEIQLIVLRIGS
jgi:hypothetical protein